MQYSIALLALVATAVSAGGAGPYPGNGTEYTTITTTAFTTYCPEPTTLTHGGKTYTVTTATTLTITDCPCTITQPIIPPPKPTTVLYTSCPPGSSNTPPPPPPPPASKPTTTYSQPLTVITQTSKGVTSVITSTVGCPGAGCAPPPPPPSSPATCNGNCPSSPPSPPASTPATCNGNCPHSGVASGTGSGPSPTKPSQYTGAASANKVGGMMLAAAGVVAIAL
jgi:hypothetical protein